MEQVPYDFLKGYERKRVFVYFVYFLIFISVGSVFDLPKKKLHIFFYAAKIKKATKFYKKIIRNPFFRVIKAL